MPAPAAHLLVALLELSDDVGALLRRQRRAVRHAALLQDGLQHGGGRRLSPGLPRRRLARGRRAAADACSRTGHPILSHFVSNWARRGACLCRMTAVHSSNPCSISRTRCSQHCARCYAPGRQPSDSAPDASYVMHAGSDCELSDSIHNTGDARVCTATVRGKLDALVPGLCTAPGCAATPAVDGSPGGPPCIGGASPGCCACAGDSAMPGCAQAPQGHVRFSYKSQNPASTGSQAGTNSALQRDEGT